ncbi:unnamed protein product [Peniophora sp. CBMAI 1063]|nr:unnamed protein product [Peniophora sp. CBMAI 1063]
MGPKIILDALTSTAKTANFAQILLVLPLTLSTLSKPAFLLLSLLLFAESIVHGTFLLFFPNTSAFHFTQLPSHALLLLLCFNVFAQSVHPIILSAADWWGAILNWSSPFFIFLEGISTLLVAQRMGQAGRSLIEADDSYQFIFLFTSAATYVVSCAWIVIAYPDAANSPLSSTLLGVAMTCLVFLTVIGLILRRTTIIESSALTLFVAYNVWLCGFSKDSLSGIVGFTSYASYAPLFENLLPHLTTLANFITNTMPKHVLVSLIYRISILLGAARILPSIGADSSWELAVDDADARPTSRLAHILLIYRQAILVTVYSHLLLLDESSHSWWRWMSVFVTLFLWGLELFVTDEDDITKDWKVD